MKVDTGEDVRVVVRFLSYLVVVWAKKKWLDGNKQVRVRTHKGGYDHIVTFI
jgi:hypothetical protein